MSGVGGVGRVHLHQLAHLIKFDLPQCDAGKEGGAPQVGRDRIGDLFDGAVEHVGVDLAPQVRVGSSPDEAYGIEAPSGEFLHGLVQPSAVVGDPFEHRPYEMGSGGAEGDIVETTPGGMVVHRRTLSGQPGGEEDVTASGRCGGRQCRERGVAGGNRVGESVVGGDDPVAEPLQAGASGLVVVGDEEAVSGETGDRGDLVGGVGLLVGYRATDP